MKDVRPQVFLGIIVLGALAGYALSLQMSEVAMGCVAGVVYAVKVLSNGKEE